MATILALGTRRFLDNENLFPFRADRAHCTVTASFDHNESSFVFRARHCESSKQAFIRKLCLKRVSLFVNQTNDSIYQPPRNPGDRCRHKQNCSKFGKPGCGLIHAVVHCHSGGRSRSERYSRTRSHPTPVPNANAPTSANQRIFRLPTYSNPTSRMVGGDARSLSDIGV